MITLDCPNCGARLGVPDEWAGQRGTCKACGASITAPYRNPPPLPTERLHCIETRRDTRRQNENSKRRVLRGIRIGCVCLAAFFLGVILLAFDAVLDQFVESPTGVLIGALESNNFELAEDALLRGADFNVRIAGRPLIFHYVHNGNAGATRFLLDHGADVNSKSNLGRSLLHEAALNGQPEIVTILLEYGADVNGTNPRGDTALFYAEDQKKLGAPMTEGRAEAARILRANGGVK